MRLLTILSCFLILSVSYSQSPKLKLNLDETGKTYIKGSVRAMFWARYMDMNPGTTVNGELTDNGVDFSIRRIRINLKAQLTPKLFVYGLFGGNNVNIATEKEWRFGVLDLNAEYTFAPEFAIGIGKNAWEGLSRNLVRNSGTLMAVDAPLYSLLSVNKNDDVGRGFGIWAKGQIGKFDYVLSLKKPVKYGVVAQEGITDYALNNPRMRSSAYVKYEVLENESNQTAYSGGNSTYLGKKRLLNIGIGALYEPKMMSRLENGEEQLYDFKNWAAEIFYDTPLNIEKATALTFYLGYYDTNFGKDYVRNVGANDYTDGGTSFNGSGNDYPMNGTGNTWFLQFGYLLGKNMLGSTSYRGQLQPNIAIQHSNFDALADPVTVYDAGINWYFNGHSSKLSLGYQSRPIFEEQSSGIISKKSRKGQVVLQYQVIIN
ncbi:hypothetical protein SAMN05216480_102225 [Pustulibacterium marinum]|uniref:Short chain amide porin n=1 Tax=Pustulibacterium marinum TaxID=1224947 RepID=A0A1I7FTN4_9FLAO|nr:porin [Pustulibacterium marinum]SFU39533.1 hypothetical protein SAMN05216480_102225 [Pustulibacterium marinum]